VAALGYVYEGEWLDAVNSWLWIGVVVLLEFEVRYPRAVDRQRAWFAGVATTLYTGLAALVLVWAWRGEWFDAYDALLWLIAFVTIEIDVLQISRGQELKRKAM
jgi:CHASE2 domain-containing sensor protein